MVFLYLLIGFLAAVVAALPPGAANIVVVNTTIKQTITNAFYIIVGAGIGEVALSLFALHCTMNLTDFFAENSWVQISVFVLFILVGIFFLIKNRLTVFRKSRSIAKLKLPKFVKGLLLALINPPVLIFWVLAFTIIHKHVLSVSEMSPWFTLLLFFTGVLLGKTTTLYGYSQWGKKLEKSSGDTKKMMNLVIGFALVVVGLFQGVRFFIT